MSRGHFNENATTCNITWILYEKFQNHQILSFQKPWSKRFGWCCGDRFYAHLWFEMNSNFKTELSINWFDYQPSYIKMIKAALNTVGWKWNNCAKIPLLPILVNNLCSSLSWDWFWFLSTNPEFWLIKILFRPWSSRNDILKITGKVICQNKKQNINYFPE